MQHQRLCRAFEKLFEGQYQRTKVTRLARVFRQVLIGSYFEMVSLRDNSFYSK